MTLPTTETTTKRCPKCGRELSRSDFSKNTRAADGLQAYCKDCQSEYIKQRYKALTTCSTASPNPTAYFDERLKGITPRELIDELKKRGYTGELQYREVKVYRIEV